MRVQIVQVPYDPGHRNFRMGRGPEHLVKNGMLETLLGDEHRFGQP